MTEVRKRSAREPKKEDPSAAAMAAGATAGLTTKETAARENKMWSIVTRIGFCFAMLFIFIGVLLLGHFYVCIGIILIQFCCFRELSNVRIKASEEIKLASDGASGKMPLFRTIQYCWFFLALFQTWSTSAVNFAKQYPERAGWASELHKFHVPTTMCLMSILIISTVLSLRRSQVKYQMGQYSWTAVTCAITVLQLKHTFQLVYSGYFWFVLPAMLVACNDCCAYIWGMSMGKKIFGDTVFLEISPNKTWEGFLGGGLSTIAFSFLCSYMLLHSKWMICAPPVTLMPFASFDCEPHAMFQSTAFLSALGEVFPAVMVQLASQVPYFHTLTCAPVQVHAILLGTFASLVCPFGGFMASAVKRAYSIKDFDSFIPGHGGLMDRMDCQVVMLLGTGFYLRTFIWNDALSVEALVAAYQELSAVDKAAALSQLKAL